MQTPMRSKRIIISALFLVGLLGCDRQDTAVTENAKTEPVAQSLGITADCVICVDHPMEVKSTTPFSDHDGKRYYFCSDYCKKEFDADPAKALAKYQRQRAPASQPTSLPAGHTH